MDAEVEALVSYLEHQRLIADYAFVVSAGLVVYDLCITLGREIEFVWCKRWTYSTVLYLIIRYLPLITVYFVLHNQVMLGVTPEQCNWTFPVLMWMMLITIIACEVVLMIRTWAVWQRDWRVGTLLGLIITGTIGWSIYDIFEFQRSLVYGIPPYPGFRGCFVISAGDLLRIDFIVLACLESVVLLLMIISAYRSYKIGDDSKLMSVVYRDGVFVYFFIHLVTVANVICMSLASEDLEFVFTPICAASYSVLTCHAVLNIREITARDVANGSTRNYIDEPQELALMVFSSPVDERAPLSPKSRSRFEAYQIGDLEFEPFHRITMESTSTERTLKVDHNPA